MTAPPEADVWRTANVREIVAAYRAELIGTLCDLMDSLKEDGESLASVTITIGDDDVSVDIKVKP